MIPLDEVDRLFQPFQRLGNERDRHTDGHGLGLAIVGAIASAHGAVLAACARPEGGLDVEVSLSALGNALSPATIACGTRIAIGDSGRRLRAQPVKRV